MGARSLRSRRPKLPLPGDMSTLAQMLGAVILGAGASSRMGRPKLLLPWKGTTVVGHQVSLWRSLDVAQVALVCRPSDGMMFNELDRIGVGMKDRIINPEPDRGMFSSIVCAAGWPGWRSEISHMAISLGDQPHLEVQTLSSVLAFAGENPAMICQPAFNGRPRHPVIIPFDKIRHVAQSGRGNLKEFLHSCAGEIALLEIADPGLNADMDTPQDYEALLAH